MTNFLQDPRIIVMFCYQKHMRTMSHGIIFNPWNIILFMANLSFRNQLQGIKLIQRNDPLFIVGIQ